MEIVLKNVSFIVKPTEKIGIVGRTGAGKSTLCLALCRIIESYSGCILMDDIDISKVDLNDLRSNIAVIPQDPTIFTGTLRFNLDPTGQLSDHEIIEIANE